jgi:hypothetical protein
MALYQNAPSSTHLPPARPELGTSIYPVIPALRQAQGYGRDADLSLNALANRLCGDPINGAGISPVNQDLFLQRTVAELSQALQNPIL